MNPFVAVSAVFNVPAQMLPSATPHGPTDMRDNSTMEISTNVTTIDDRVGTPSATSTMNEWGRHGFIITEIHMVLSTMEPPWGSLQVFEVMERRFPEVDKIALQMTVSAVLMTQRQCVRELTLAEARKGPRRDENGEVFIELDLVYANKFSDSY